MFLAQKIFMFYDLIFSRFKAVSMFLYKKSVYIDNFIVNILRCSKKNTIGKVKKIITLKKKPDLVRNFLVRQICDIFFEVSPHFRQFTDEKILSRKICFYFEKMMDGFLFVLLGRIIPVFVGNTGGGAIVIACGPTPPIEGSW